MSLPILYSYRRCPYAMRARMALRYAGIATHIHEISLRDKPPAMLAVSPKGTVPVLVLPDGQVLEQSLDVMRWALLQQDVDDWALTGNPSAQDSIQRLISENDGSFKQALDRYKYADRYPEHPAEFYRAQGEIFLTKLESLLMQNHYLLGDRISLADIAIFPFIRQFAAVDQAWLDTAPYPKTRAWLNSLVSSSLFLHIMEKRV